jgi:hypothetical protein
MYQGPTSTKFGQFSVAEPLRFDLLEFHDDSPLEEVQHDIPIPVLDQEDLQAQGIDVSALVSGAQNVDALGSCTCNSGTAHLAERWVAAGKDLATIKLTGGAAGPMSLSATDSKADEEFAIVLYHVVTDQTGAPSQEWPPTDCGSNGLYVCQELITQGLAASYKSAPNVTAALTLLQTGTVMQGGPWFNSWMNPDANGFVDGDGSIAATHAAIKSGVAGGHETLQHGIPQIAQLANGSVDLVNTVIRVRNSWSAKFGIGGDYLLHASTLDYLARYYDFKSIVLA